MISVVNKIDVITDNTPDMVKGHPVSCETGEGIKELKIMLKEKLRSFTR